MSFYFLNVISYEISNYLSPLEKNNSSVFYIYLSNIFFVCVRVEY